jgi:hypothetical protein
MKENLSTSELQSPSGWGVYNTGNRYYRGKCVRLTKGDYEQKKIYNENPLEVAKEFENAGLQRLHLVDLDGLRQARLKIGKYWNKLRLKPNW